MCLEVNGHKDDLTNRPKLDRQHGPGTIGTVCRCTRVLGGGKGMSGYLDLFISISYNKQC